METKTAYQPRVVRGRVELWVPHNGGEIAFASPSIGPTNYRNAGRLILENGQKVPTGDYTASLLHPAYCTNASNEPEFANVRDITKRNWLWVFNRDLWAENGVYVLQDEEAIGRSQPLNVKDLEKMLKNGEDISGIRFSKDGKARFAPKGSYTLGEHSSEAFAKDGFIIASCGQEGAEKLGEVSAKFRNKPYISGIEVQEGQTPEQRVSAVDEGDGRLCFFGSWSYLNVGHAFGVYE